MITFIKSQALIFLSIFFFTTNVSYAYQADTTIEKRLNKIDYRSHFEIYTGFLSKITYEGRFYGTSGIALYPTVAYKHKCGFEANVSNSLWTGYSPVFTQSEVNLGYSKSPLSWLGTGLTYTRTFMYYGTDSDKRAMNNAINLNLGFYMSWANIGVDYSYMFGYDKASGLHIGINRDFPIYSFLGSDKFTISPSLGAWWGPQTIFYHFFSKNAVKKINRGLLKKNGKGGTTTTSSSQSNYEEGTVFQILNYQIGIPLNYRIGHFNFELAFRIDFPMNLPADYTYGSSPVTYFTGSVKYIF
jgi:hypothetical protein